MKSDVSACVIIHLHKGNLMKIVEALVEQLKTV